MKRCNSRAPGYTISLRIDGPRWAQPAVEQMADAFTDIGNALYSIALTYRQEHEYATNQRSKRDGTATRGGDELLRAAPEDSGRPASSAPSSGGTVGRDAASRRAELGASGSGPEKQWVILTDDGQTTRYLANPSLRRWTTVRTEAFIFATKADAEANIGQSTAVAVRVPVTEESSELRS